MFGPAPPLGRITAVLGPTNTGKTHFAMERMLAQASGILGFPLRLLARENYDRAVRLKGASQVALITGEEKIVPKGARWFLCTVESMPLDREVAFVGVDEIQMCADPDRGHVFTDRLLHARGRDETMIMGAETIRPLLTRLLPEADIITRPRFSTLSHTGPKKITRLPARSAAVAFSAANVYALAELIRRQRGGAAVVLGALSPRTRNAQVAMYQAGDVDYLVATDAIGMGLNMDVDHVAFAGLKKFDGRRVRPLAAAELAQVAGRAGRHMNDGTFGTTAEAGTLPDEIAERIEEHHFEPLTQIYWRNTDLDNRSLEALRRTLALPPTLPGLMRARAADDEVILDRLRRDPDIAARAAGPAAVSLLWEVCQIPDFRGVMSDAHASLVAAVYKHLTNKGGRLPLDWIAGHVTRHDRTDGDIDTLIGRIAGIRTWTYVSFRPDWVPDALHWQERTRAIEDKLSDALHDRLRQRFVDRRTAVLLSKLKDSAELAAAVRADGEVLVEGEAVGKLEALRFIIDEMPTDGAGRMVLNAAHRALRDEIGRRARRIADDADKAFSLAPCIDGAPLPRILWQGHPVGRLVAGPTPSSPDAAVIADDTLEPADRDRVQRRLRQWLRTNIDRAMAALVALDGADLTGTARGLAFQLREGMGSLRRAGAAAEIAGLEPESRRRLRALGVIIGRDTAYLPALLKPKAVFWRGLLWQLARGEQRYKSPPAPGHVSVPLGRGVDADFLEACGFRPLGPLAVRVDMAERLTNRAWTLAKGGRIAPTSDLTSMVGATAAQFPAVMRALGFKRVQKGDDPSAERYLPETSRRRPPKKSAAARRSAPNVDPHSPFAKLGELSFGD